MTKKCKECDAEKDIDQFYKQKTSKDGHHNKCKVCYSAEYNERFKQKMRDLKIETLSPITNSETFDIINSLARRIP